MKTQIDTLMQEHRIDALLVTGSAIHNPAMVYLTGGGHITSADLVKPRHQQAILFCGPMERDEAAKSGLSVRLYSDYPLKPLLEQAGQDYTRALAMRYRQMLSDLGLNRGRVALYGQVEIGPIFGILKELSNLLPEIEWVGFARDPILMPAMMTKEPQEIERIRHMAQITTEVVGRTADFLAHHRVENEVLIRPDGKPLTVGDVKSRINLWLSELGAENPEGTIFAIGRDAGVPHSSGNPADLIRLGKTIVFDIFPCEAGGGYYYDFTRTWSLGYASDEALELYRQVQNTYDTIVSELTLNTPFSHYQQRTCQLFEQLGHPTIQSDPQTQEGYVHSVGHGLGLRIHEMPFSGAVAGDQDELVPGVVFTIEPGLYYPSRDMGFRIEDTYVACENGTFERLADYPYDFVLPMRT
ncbi:Xaa-Pro peptidase family protein [Bellilinea sp.]|jgi:Xaa-Pro aminopeptidase|uniref:Xaa-Pro peptidase family protein n=1 Tax=Bellilinea sp. TaxID=2838785 RepID=UPI002ADE4831|nr:Xaa-Pro peptidase family protein [Bellilinea sp.]